MRLVTTAVLDGTSGNLIQIAQRVSSGSSLNLGAAGRLISG
jgi:hypothetical protein